MTAPMEVGICCSDLERLTAFYVETLGCKLVSVIDVDAERASEAALAAQGYRVARLQTPWGERIKLLAPAEAPQSQEAPDWILSRRNAVYLTFIVDDLETMLARLEGRAELLSGPERVEVRPGVWLAFARDPEGNVLEFVEYDDVAGYRDDLAVAGGLVDEETTP